MRPLEEPIAALLPEVTALRRDLHARPELGFEEKRTAETILKCLEGIEGLSVRTGVAGTGIVATLGADLPGPCVALRADMDALPMEETSGVSWSSREPGKAHACGHDGHVAMLVGAARILGGLQDELQGPVRFLFQPAEEGGGGGGIMCREGALKDPDVQAVFGLHNNLPDGTTKAGQIRYVPGAAMAGTGTFDIEITGQGGHAALPHRCIDPLYVGACVVDQLQGIVSRQINPLVPAVVSVTRFHAGTAYNVIPHRVQLAGTFRALDDAVLDQLREAIVERVRGVAEAHGAAVRIRCERGYPVLRNSERAIAIFRAILGETGDLERVAEADPVMGGEDFAYFAEAVPGLFYWLPSCPEGRASVPACHDPAFDFNDDLLPLGMRLHVEVARRFAAHWKP